MTSLADQLPPDIARQIHPQWRKNEAEYWANRGQLLTQYGDLWVAFADGQVIASNRNAALVLDASLMSGRHAFVTCVGRENEPAGRIRRITSPYDSLYPGEPLPVITVEFRQQPNTSGTTLTRVIPDTGADVTALPWADCQRLGLDPAMGLPATMGGVGGYSFATVIFSLWAHVDGRDYRCRLQIDPSGSDRILGRDVLNQLDILFRGPAAELVINP